MQVMKYMRFTHSENESMCVNIVVSTFKSWLLIGALHQIAFEKCNSHSLPNPVTLLFEETLRLFLRIFFMS